ncbi:hypothetical protein EON67_05795 [archaeon]|nr:MAG: hypothetical protein EON67_05795 [archaeon]
MNNRPCPDGECCHRLGGAMGAGNITWGLYGTCLVAPALRSCAHAPPPLRTCLLTALPPAMRCCARHADNTNPSRGVYFQYTNGDMCPTGGAPRSLRVWLQCLNDASNIPDDEFILESTTTPCLYELFMKSAFGCPVQCPITAVCVTLLLLLLRRSAHDCSCSTLLTSPRACAHMPSTQRFPAPACP